MQTILHNNKLEKFLGRRWDMRVENNRGKFERVVKGSVSGGAMWGMGTFL